MKGGEVLLTLLPVRGYTWGCRSIRASPAALVGWRSQPRFSMDEVASHFGVAKESVCRRIEQKGLLAHRTGMLGQFKLTEICE